MTQATASVNGVQCHIDQYVVFGRLLRIAGWIWMPGRELSGLTLRFRTGDPLPLTDFRLPSNDVAAVVDPTASQARFRGEWLLDACPVDLLDAQLEATFTDGGSVLINRPGTYNLDAEPNHQLYEQFLQALRQASPGIMLEIGSRARSGIVRRDRLPSSWTYTGLDVLAGENVDIVGDAHQLSHLFPPDSFSAVMAFSVFEHLLMPWKVVVELNRVMRIGAIGLVVTHQCWPMHDEPWDFWRFSAESWKSLFNADTGFDILEAVMGEPAFIVARCGHAVTNFASQDGGFLASAVMFRKTAATRLSWDVNAELLLGNPYPSATTIVSTTT